MFANWMRAARPKLADELGAVADHAPELVARLVSEELDVAHAVILLMALPTEASEKIFRNLSDERAESFTRKAAELGPLDERTREFVLSSALRRLRQP